MSWHYLQEQAVESLEAVCSDGEPLPPLRSKSTHAEFYCNGRLMESYLDSLSGTMSARSTDDHGEELLTWYREGFHVSILASLEKGQELPARKVASGPKWQGSFAKWNHDTSSWKTHQCSLLGGWESFSETWPRWGMMRDGACWERTMPAHLTSGTVSGSRQTPTVEDAGRNGSSEDWKKWKENGQTSGCRLRNQVQHWPTPAARDSKGANSREHCKTNGTGRKHMDQLPNAVAYPDLKFPTPRTPSKSGGGTGLDGGSGARSMMTEKDRKELCGGSLNPTWVEWLMNWPVGWTQLEPLDAYEFEYWKTASSTIGEGCFLREMWFNREAGAPSQGQESNEQPNGEHRGPLFEMPPLRALEIETGELPDLRVGVSTEEGAKSEALRKFRVQQDSRQELRRVEVGTMNRSARLKALGNGQVPAVAALAWRILTTDQK